MRIFIFMFLLFLVVSTEVEAVIPGKDSLEWQVLRSDTICTGRVTGIIPVVIHTNTDGTKWYTNDVAVKVDRMIKGGVSTEVHFTWSLSGTTDGRFTDRVQQWLTSGDQFLFFFKTGQDTDELKLDNYSMDIVDLKTAKAWDWPEVISQTGEVLDNEKDIFRVIQSVMNPGKNPLYKIDPTTHVLQSKNIVVTTTLHGQPYSMSNKAGPGAALKVPVTVSDAHE